MRRSDHESAEEESAEGSTEEGSAEGRDQPRGSASLRRRRARERAFGPERAAGTRGRARARRTRGRQAARGGEEGQGAGAPVTRANPTRRRAAGREADCPLPRSGRKAARGGTGHLQLSV